MKALGNSKRQGTDFVTQKAAAEYLRITERKVHELHRQGVLRRHTSRGKGGISYKREDLDTLLV